MRDRRRIIVLQALNSDGRVACNARDREAAHRAFMHRIATENPAAVTCAKCLKGMRRRPPRT